MSALLVRPMPPGDWHDATGLMARAFLHEPFIVGLYGPDPLARYAACVQRYRAQPWPEGDVMLGAYTGPTLVGTVLVSPPGSCHACDIGERPDDPIELLDWEFYRECRDAHEAQGAHAWLGRLAVEPALHGTGVGSALLTAAAAAAADLGPMLLLECEGHRRGLYERAGFREVALIPDTVGPPALLMRRDSR